MKCMWGTPECENAAIYNISMCVDWNCHQHLTQVIILIVANDGGTSLEHHSNVHFCHSGAGFLTVALSRRTDAMTPNSPTCFYWHFVHERRVQASTPMTKERWLNSYCGFPCGRSWVRFPVELIELIITIFCKTIACCRSTLSQLDSVWNENPKKSTEACSMPAAPSSKSL